MIIIERHIQKIYPDKWAELENINKKWVFGNLHGEPIYGGSS